MSDSYSKKTKRNPKKTLKGGESETVEVSDKSQTYAHIEPIQAKPLEVRVYNNGFERALKAFRALVQKERILSSYKEKQTYEKPSDKKRRKRNEAKRKVLEYTSFDRDSKPFKKSFKKTSDSSE